jgi:hypothetical protein
LHRKSLLQLSFREAPVMARGVRVPVLISLSEVAMRDP